MPKNLLIDGIRFNFWKPKNETKDFEPVIREHAKDIFGKNSLYFDIKPELRSKAGIGSKPDGFVIDFSNQTFYVVEVETAEHGVHDHVVTQISKFNSAMKKHETRERIIKALYDEIKCDSDKDHFVKSRIREELFKFITELIKKPLTIAVVIDEFMDELGEAVDELPLKLEIIEFQTFTREDAPTVHAHLFETLAQSGEAPQIHGMQGARVPVSEKQQKYQEFFTDLLNQLKLRKPDITHANKASPASWFSFAAGKSGFYYSLGFAQGNRFRVELYIDTGNKEVNKKAFDALAQQTNEIEQELKASVSWERLDEKRACRIAIYHEGKIEDNTQSLDELKTWAIEMMIKFHQSLSPRIARLNLPKAKNQP